MFDRLRFPALFFFAASLLALLQLYYAIGGRGWQISISALILGLVLGFSVQLCFRESLPKRKVAVASFLGGFVLWLPVVLVTYGFALAATPIFLAYAATVVIGVHAASLLRKTRAHKDVV